MNHPIHTMVLQPIVENSISHGFTNKKPPCIILIRGRMSANGFLHLNIYDNGAGMDEATVKKINSFISDESTTGFEKEQSIGISSIFRRMKHSFGDRYEMKVVSKLGHYSVLELVIPGEARYDDGVTPQ